MPDGHPARTSGVAVSSDQISTLVLRFAYFLYLSQISLGANGSLIHHRRKFAAGLGDGMEIVWRKAQVLEPPGNPGRNAGLPSLL